MRRLRRLLGQSGFDLLQNCWEVFGLGIAVAGVVPLETRFVPTVDPPVSVAEMIVEYRVGRLEADRLLKRVGSLIVLPQLKMSPAEAVDDVAVIRLEFDRALQHAERFAQIYPLVDPRIAKVVQDLRLIGVK